MSLEAVRFRRGEAAYRQGDYAAAVSFLMPVAGRGLEHRARAGAYFATLYAQGLGGLPRDPAAARYWRRVASGERRLALPAWLGRVRAGLARMLRRG